MMEQLGKYQLIKLLGNGCFGEVYRARDLTLNADKAVKIIELQDNSKIETLLNEAKILYELKKHENIVHVNEANIFKRNEKLVVVIDMEYLPNGSLESLQAQNFISVHESCRVMGDVLFGLDYAHNHKILHRDIKPANILMDNYRRPKLSDFGLATKMDTFGFSLPEHKGYLIHCAPEVFRSHQSTILTDIYAFGITFFRIINNYTDFRNRVENCQELNIILLKGLLIDNIGFQPYIPDKIKKLVKRITNIDTSRRIQNVSALRQEFAKLKEHIEWKPCTCCSWEGLDKIKKNSINLEIINNELIYKCNSRRVNSKCQKCGNMNDAKNEMFRIIRETTFG